VAAAAERFQERIKNKDAVDGIVGKMDLTGARDLSFNLVFQQDPF
jgi:hypothetical protein